MKLRRNNFTRILEYRKGRRKAGYRQTPHWAKVSRIAMTITGGRCVLCRDANAGVYKNSRSHYRREELGDVVVLCKRCYGMTANSVLPGGEW